MPRKIPSSIYVMAWIELGNSFGERHQQDELDLMASVLRGVIISEDERLKSKPKKRSTKICPGCGTLNPIDVVRCSNCLEFFHLNK